MRLFLAATVVVSLACGRRNNLAEAFTGSGSLLRTESSNNNRILAFSSAVAAAPARSGNYYNIVNAKVNVNINMVAASSRATTGTIRNSPWYRSSPRPPSSSLGTETRLNNNLRLLMPRRQRRHHRSRSTINGTTTRLSMRQGSSGGRGDGSSGGGGGRGGGGKELPMGIRLLGTVPYLLPLLDGIEEGDNLFRALPGLRGAVYTVLAPFLALWDHVPFLPLITFIFMVIAAREQNTSRFVRFNIQQAIYVDVFLIVLQLFGNGVGVIVPDGGTEVVTNFGFYCLVAVVAYATAETVRGRVPNKIPLISAAADMQIGP